MHDTAGCFFPNQLRLFTGASILMCTSTWFLWPGRDQTGLQYLALEKAYGHCGASPFCLPD